MQYDYDADDVHFKDVLPSANVIMFARIVIVSFVAHWSLTLHCQEFTRIRLTAIVLPVQSCCPAT